MAWQKRLTDRVFLVTGATNGIGKAAVLELARRDATIELVGRNKAKTEAVVEELVAATGNRRIDYLLGDLSLRTDVRAVAEKFAQRHSRLDVLVNNAGAFFTEYGRTSEGIEQTFALNHLSYFHLTNALLPALQMGKDVRVVSTSSGAHQGARMKVDQLVERRDGGGFPAYADSKLANILFTKALARRLVGSGITASCFHPGFVGSGFGQNNGDVLAWGIKKAAEVFGRIPEQGAETLVWLAINEEATRWQGEYFFDCAPVKPSALALNEELGERLWELSRSLG